MYILFYLDLVVICVKSLCPINIHIRSKNCSKEGKDKEVGGSSFNYKGPVREFLELHYMWNKYEVVAYRVFATFMLKKHINLLRAEIKS